MTKKPARKKNKSHNSRSKRKQKTVNTRSIVIIVSFIFLVAFVLSGLYSLKNEFFLKNNGFYNQIFSSKIEEVDRSLYEIFFKLGVSNKDVLKESSSEKSEEGLVWNIRKQSIKLNKQYSKDQITEVFSQLLPVEDIVFNIETKGSSHLSTINIYGFNTHIVNFIYKKEVKKSPARQNLSPKSLELPKKSAVTTELKTNKKVKVKDSVLYKGKRPKISIIVDDIGINKNAVDQLIGISNNFTFAILPNRLFTSYAVEMANKNNIDILLHQPMEPKSESGYSADDAGEGVLLVGQTKEDILKTLNRNLSSIPNVVGINNHMGSKFTENEELMLLIMKNIKNKNLFFVDSLTSPNSKGYIIAKKMGIRAAKRDIFLDNNQKGKNYVKDQLRKLITKAQKKGYAVGICHTYPQTIEALREEIHNIKKEVNITPINNLYN